MFNVLIGGPIETWLGIAIMADRTPIASMYSLSSTHTGGGMLWAVTELATVIAFVPIFVQWYRSEEREAARLDAGKGRRRPATPVVGDRSQQSPIASAWEHAWLARTGRVPTETTSPIGLLEPAPLAAYGKAGER
jgi:hypothetical protein